MRRDAVDRRGIVRCMNKLSRTDDVRLSTVRDILIIEDDPTQAEELALYIRRMGLSTQSIYSGSEAIHRVGEIRPRVALIDYNLPDLDGVTVAERIRRLSPATALVVISGRIDWLSELTLRKFGIYQFLNKPVEVRSLGRSIRHMVRVAARTGLPAVSPPKGLGSLFG